MAKIILPRNEQMRLLKHVKDLTLHQLSGELKYVREIRLFGSILRWEFGHIPEGKKTSSGIRYWSDVDFLIIAREGFRPLPHWREKFRTNHGWLCYYLPGGIILDTYLEGKPVKSEIPVSYAVVFEETLKNKANIAQLIGDGLPLKNSLFKKSYERIH